VYCQGAFALKTKLKRRVLPFCIAAVSLAVHGQAANLLVNGSFESPSVTVGGGQVFSVGSSGLQGWSVVGPSGSAVEVFNATAVVSGVKFPAQDGNQWLDLTGSTSNNLEGVSQTVSTVAGTTYTLTFSVGNASGGTFGSISTVGLKINGSLAGNYTNSTPGTTTVNWQKFSYSFIATGNSTAIEFDNLDPSDDNLNGLDNIDLEMGGTASPLPVNLITNGDFETPVVAVSGNMNVNTGSTAIPGWTVTGTAGNTVAVVSGGYDQGGYLAPAEDGAQWLNVAGSSGGGSSDGVQGIMQTVPTVAGASYSLSFWVGNVSGGDFGSTSTVGLKINGVATPNFTNSTPGTTMTWIQFSRTFVATGSSTTIEFDNLDHAGDNSNGLDNVVLQQVMAAAPSISSGGVVSASAFGGFTAASPGSWIEIYGANLSSSTRGWGGSDFNGLSAPTTLSGISVSVGGQAAFVDYISPSQINALIPSNVTSGVQPITVTNPAGTSAPFSITIHAAEPGLLAPPSFSLNGVSYAAAFFADGTYVLPVGAIAGVSSRPAKPGDTIVVYGVGFGPVTPALQAGQLVQQANSLASTFQLSIGGVGATVPYAGLAPNYTGLYQFNVVVPNVPTGNAPLTFTLGGVNSTQVLNIAVQD
jgi:uncharacterized protein (TIGR03437 family)